MEIFKSRPDFRSHEFITNSKESVEFPEPPNSMTSCGVINVREGLQLAMKIASE